MNSIDKQQPEENLKNLSGKDAIDKIRELAEKNHTCFFCTDFKAGGPVGTRPMSVRKIDDDGNLWFLSANDSHKNAELQKDPSIQLLFQGSAHSDFLNLYGNATVTADKEIIKELWEPVLQTWFTEGVDDPRITVIKVTPVEGYYWDNKHGNTVAFIKMLAGAALGKTLDDSITGSLEV